MKYHRHTTERLKIQTVFPDGRYRDGENREQGPTLALSSAPPREFGNGKGIVDLVDGLQLTLDFGIERRSDAWPAR